MKRRLVMAAVLLGVATVVVKTWPEMVRYMKIRQM